jgi:hypothetical protein
MEEMLPFLGKRRKNNIMMWLKLLGMGLKTGAHLYQNKQRTKQAMSDAQLLHAEKMRAGEIAYEGKLLEARQSDWKDEFILLLLSAPIVCFLGQYFRMIQLQWRKCNFSSNIFLTASFLVSNNFRRCHCERLRT